MSPIKHFTTPPCGVCLEEKSGRHYGANCCRGCKGFFRRSVRLQRQYVCAYAQKCVIEKAFRNCCRACRFKKCLEIGLNPRLVHSDRSCDADAPWRERSASNASDERKPDSTTLDSPPGNGAVTVWRPKQEPTDVLDDLFPESFAFDCQILIESSKFKFEFENNGTLGSKQLIPLFDRRDIRSVVRYLLLVDEFIDNFAEHQHNHINSPLHFYDIHTDLENAFYHQPRKMCQRSKARNTHKLQYSSVDALQMLWQPRELLTGQAFRSVWCRIALHYVDWASFIPELYELNVEDQLRMIVGRCVPLLWQIIAHRSYKNTNMKCVLTTGGTYVPLEGKEREQLEKEPATKFAIEAGSWLTDCFVEPAKELNVTDAEFSLLRVIAFLSPVPQLSPEGRKTIREAQRFYQSCLLKLIQTQSDPISAAKRISELLCLLPPIEHVSTIEDNHMTVMTLFNQNNMKGDLTYAFYLQRHLRS
ncbi:Nuclear hormone receptor family member nhr-34 [Aphelenchoides besseyi]|nr:Nuclear hormone receptor family member nhr-34 [Aphelenchoides besseyi]